MSELIHHTFLGAPQSNPTTSKTSTMSVEIRLHYYTAPNERVCVAGNMFDDIWAPHEMQSLNNNGDGWWHGMFHLPDHCYKNNAAAMEYKFVVLRSCGNNRWEECENRVVSTPLPARECELIYTDWWAYPLATTLVISGVPEVVKPAAKKTEPVVEKKPEPVVEKKPEPVVEKKPEPVVEKKPEPVVEKKAEPVVEKKPEPVVEKKPEPVVEKTKGEPAVVEEPESDACKKGQCRKSRELPAQQDPQRETVDLKHVEPYERPPIESMTLEQIALRHIELMQKDEAAQDEEEKPTQGGHHKKRSSIVQECKKVFEPEGTTQMGLPDYLRKSLKNSSAGILSQYSEPSSK